MASNYGWSWDQYVNTPRDVIARLRVLHQGIAIGNKSKSKVR